MAYAKEKRERLDRIATEMRDIVDRADKQNGFKPGEREKWDKLEAEYSQLEQLVVRAEKSNRIADNLTLADGLNGITIGGDLEEIKDTYRLSRPRKDNSPHAKAFSAFLRKGIDGLEDGDRSLMAANFRSNGIQNAQSTTGSQGGYLIPQGFSGQLDQAMKWFGGINGTVGTFETETGNPLPWPTTNDTTNRGRIIGQNVQVTETDVVFGQITFNAYIGSSDLVLVPLSLIEDSYFDMDALVADMLGTRLGRLFNWKCTVGTGSGEPTGIVTAAVAAGNVYTCGTGETGSIIYTDLVNLEHSVDPAYRNPSSCFMFSDAMLKGIKKLVDGNNRPLWQPGLTASFQEGAAVNIGPGTPTILGYRYVINQDMAVPAANAYSILFGDMSKFKVRRLRAGTTVMRLVERYADYLQLGFIGFTRFDSNLIDSGTHPVAVLQQSAS